MSAGLHDQSIGQGEFVPRREARSHWDRFVLWLSVLTGLTAWVAALALSWILTPWSVTHGTNRWLLVVNVVAAVITLAALILSWTRWHGHTTAEGTDTTSAPEQTDRFMAELGLASSLLFLLIIIAQSAAIFFLGPGL